MRGRVSIASLRRSERATSFPNAIGRMKKYLDYFWPALGLVAVIASIYLLYHEFRGQDVGTEVWAALHAISPRNYLLAGAGTILAYFALAWYDRIALLHLGVKAYFLAVRPAVLPHHLRALAQHRRERLFRGVVRYRGYSTKGLTASQVAVLVVLCSYTFGFGNVLLGGLLLTYDPDLMQRLSGFLPDIFTHPPAARAVGLACLAGVALLSSAALMPSSSSFRIGATRSSTPAPTSWCSSFSPRRWNDRRARSSISRCPRTAIPVSRRARRLPSVLLGGAGVARARRARRVRTAVHQINARCRARESFGGAAGCRSCSI